MLLILHLLDGDGVSTPTPTIIVVAQPDSLRFTAPTWRVIYQAPSRIPTMAAQSRRTAIQAASRTLTATAPLQAYQRAVVTSAIPRVLGVVAPSRPPLVFTASARGVGATAQRRDSRLAVTSRTLIVKAVRP